MMLWQVGEDVQAEGLVISLAVVVEIEPQVIQHAIVGVFRTRLDDAQVAVEAALRIEEETGRRAHFADLLRRKGEIFVQRRNSRVAETCFRRALEVAREHQTKSIELRTATSLASLLRDQDRGDQARALLQPVYDWFTEGFDTADLKDAKRLLEELAGAVRTLS